MRSIPSVGARVIEPLKWLALAIMLAEHWMRYVVGDLPPWLFNLGRLVLPLFTFALALGTQAQPCSKLPRILIRMFLWAAIAQATLQFVDAPDDRLNVLFTFALGVTAAYGFSCIRSLPLVAAILCVIGVVSWWCEFGPVGVAFVGGCVALARARDRPAAAWISVLALLALLVVPNGNHYALAAVPLTWLLARIPNRVPRLRGAFYWAYALQFPVYAGARMVLA